MCWFMYVVFLTWSTTMQLKSHGDMPVPTTRVNTDITSYYWWSQCACDNRFSIVVSYKVLYRESNYENDYERKVNKCPQEILSNHV